MVALPGDLDACLRALEAQIVAGAPGTEPPVAGILGCTFWLGGRTEEKMRAKSPPFVVWDVHAAEAHPPRDIAQSNQFPTVDDLVKITARCAGLVASGMQGPDTRRQQLEASRQVFLATSLAVHYQHQGYVEDHGWETVSPEGISDAYFAIDYTFAIRAPRLTPPAPTVVPTEADPTIQLQEPL